MSRRAKVNVSPRDMRIPHYLLICDEIGPGAKITYAKLTQVAGSSVRIKVCLRELAVGIGSTEEEIAHFLFELEEHGFLSIGVMPTERKSARCRGCSQRMTHLALVGSDSTLPSGRRQARARAKSEESDATSAVRRRKSKRQQPLQKVSTYSLLVCLAYAKHCKARGEPIANIHAFASTPSV
jgi:hypothetical protein